jgi:TfoX/Sxy family transcriptional regulator of competence genes
MTKDELIIAVRQALTGTRGIGEKRMFGGVAFFLHGNMLAGTASGALLLRVGKTGEAAALNEPHTRPMEMRGRKMGGYIYVDTAALTDEKRLAHWLRRAMDHVRSLPPKQAPAGKAKPAAKAKAKKRRA